MLLNDLRLKAQLYYQILYPEENGMEFEIFNFIKKYKFEQIRPLIMSLKHQKMLENLSDDLYKEILKY